uniref:Phage protein n=1 Tax=Rhizobium phage IG49 TaxID=3129228 RepID=A0AAU8HZG9_9CAUD
MLKSDEVFGIAASIILVFLWLITEESHIMNFVGILGAFTFSLTVAGKIAQKWERDMMQEESRDE